MQLDGELKQKLGEAHCPHCGTVGAIAVIGLDFPAFGRVVCAHLAAPLVEAITQKTPAEPHYIDWLSKPAETASTRRRAKRRRIVDTTDRCEICLRHVSELVAPNGLQWHHVHEVQDDGGDDDANLRCYCEDCHSLVHWVRRTLGREQAK